MYKTNIHLQEFKLNANEQTLRNFDGWTMESHIKQETIICEENNFGGRTVFPVWQMVQDDDDEEEEVHEDEEEENDVNEESVTRLTGNVRACYLSHLEKTVIKNYERCSDKDRTEWPFSRSDLLKCAAWLEYKALRSCMIVILYQRAMSRLVADIKKHTEQLRIYRKLKHFMSFDTGWSTKTTQTCDQLNFIDQGTQTDLGDIYPNDEPDNVNYQDVDIGNPVAECVTDETVQGVPIPVYVSGMSSTGFRTRTTPNLRVIRDIEPLLFTEERTPVLNGIEPLFNENVDVSNSDYNAETGVVVEEPYRWSVVENKNEKKRPRVRVKRLRKLQQSEPISNGMFNSTKEDEETRKMSIDERIAAVFGIENPEFSDEEECAMEVDTEPSMWTVEKRERQEVLHTKIIEKCVANVKKRGQMRLRFLELFGSDSEDCFDIDDDVANYKDKLAKWVVVSLMPYYREGRILSRPVFKYLARHIADNLLKTNRWPSESDVMQSVVQFFSYHDKIECEADI